MPGKKSAIWKLNRDHAKMQTDRKGTSLSNREKFIITMESTQTSINWHWLGDLKCSRTSPVEMQGRNIWNKKNGAPKTKGGFKKKKGNCLTEVWKAIARNMTMEVIVSEVVWNFHSFSKW